MRFPGAAIWRKVVAGAIAILRPKLLSCCAVDEPRPVWRQGAPATAQLAPACKAAPGESSRLSPQSVWVFVLMPVGYKPRCMFIGATLSKVRSARFRWRLPSRVRQSVGCRDEARLSVDFSCICPVQRGPPRGILGSALWRATWERSLCFLLLQFLMLTVCPANIVDSDLHHLPIWLRVST